MLCLYAFIDCVSAQLRTELMFAELASVRDTAKSVARADILAWLLGLADHDCFE